MAQQQESFLPFSMAAKSLLLPKPRGKKKHSKTSWSSLLSFRTAWSFSPLQNHMDLYLSTCFRASWFTPSFRATWFPPHLLWSRVVSSSPPKPCGPPHSLKPRGLSFSMAAGPRFKSQCPSSFAAHFRLLLQSATPASIPVFFQLYWAAIVSLGRCGPMAWSQSSPSSHAGPVTRGSCFPVPSWVEATPISLAQSRATAI